MYGVKLGYAIGAALVLFLIVGFIFNPINWFLDWLLIYETPMQKVDVLLVAGMGGDLDAAIKLYKEGMGNVFLIEKGLPDDIREEEIPIALNTLIKEYCIKSGIPEESIDSLPTKPRSMLERQTMIRDWFDKHDHASYLQFSDLYSTRHKKRMHDDTFPSGDITLVLYPSDGKKVKRKQWLHIHNTIIRMMYWTMVYRPQIRSHNEIVDTSFALPMHSRTV